MDLVATVVNATVIAIVGLVLGWFTKGRFDRMEARMDGFQRSLDAMRSDVTHVALAVGARRNAENA